MGELFSDFKLPEIEVFESAPTHYRMRYVYIISLEGFRQLQLVSGDGGAEMLFKSIFGS